MRRLALALTLIAASFSSVTLAQRPPSFPQKYRDTSVPALQVAADKGDSEAMLWLGLHYANGQGVNDNALAAVWYWKSAELGEPSAMFFIGVAYWSGRGVRQDFAEAYKWLDLSAKRGNEAERERAIGARDALTRVMSSRMLKDAQAREVDWNREFQTKSQPGKK